MLYIFSYYYYYMEITGLKYLPRCNFIVLFFPYFKNITVVPLKTGRERRVVDQKKDVWVYGWFLLVQGYRNVSRNGSEDCSCSEISQKKKKQKKLGFWRNVWRMVSFRKSLCIVVFFLCGDLLSATKLFKSKGFYFFFFFFFTMDYNNVNCFIYIIEYYIYIIATVEKIKERV